MPNPPQIQRIKILIAEDEMIVARDIKNVLQTLGYHTVAIVTTGTEAIRKTNEMHPDLILMDIKLKGKMDGIEAAKRIQKNNNIPVIYLSAYTNKQILTRAKQTEPFGYIVKPYEERALHANIQMALYKHNMDMKLQEGEQRYRNFINYTKEAIYFHEAKSQSLIEVNCAFYKMLGYDEKDLTNLKIYDFIAAPKKTIDENTAYILHTGSVIIGERKWKKKDGTTFFVNITACKISEKGKDIICVIAHDLTAEKRKEEQVLRRRKIRAKAVIEGEEEERKRISREIHDGLGQMLMTIKVELINLQKNSLSQDHDRILILKQLLDSTITEAKRISANLMPSVLSDYGIVPALRTLCDDTTKITNVGIIFNAYNIKDRLNANIEVGLFRIAQEAINNIIKHASAHEANVQLIHNKGQIRLVIEDDGKGFDFLKMRTSIDRSVKKGRGLNHIRERIEVLNGTINVDSTPGSGTMVTVIIPLNNNPKTKVKKQRPMAKSKKKQKARAQ